MTLLFDTNACSALINGRYRVARSSHREANRQRLELFFAGPIALLPFAEEDAKVAGAVRAALEADGKPIGATTC